MLNQSDGEHSLLDIAQRAKLPYERIHDAAKVLSENGLLEVKG
jgi:aminopeptidase-like protein